MSANNTLTPDQIADYNGSLEQIRDIQLAIDYKANEAAREAAALPLSHIAALRASL